MKQADFRFNPRKPSSSNQHCNPVVNAPTLAFFELLQLCLQPAGESVWTEFIRVTQPVVALAVIRTARQSQTPQTALVDDLVQEAYLKLCANDFRALRELRLENDAQLLGYLKVVASNVVQDHFRAELCEKRGSGRKPEELDPAAPFATDSVHSVERRDRQILIREIADCVRSSTSGPNAARDYAIFWLYYVVGYSAPEIARHPSIGLSVKGVESALLRITAIVREGLSGKDSQPH